MNRSGFTKISVFLIAIVCVGLVIASFWVNGSNTTEVPPDDAITFKVFRGEFVASVVEPGDIESSSNIEIRCQVKSQGREGTTILEIIQEGEMVNKGDFLCQLDDSMLRDQLVEQRIQVATDKALVIQAKSDLETAERMLDEFRNGTYEQDIAVLEAEKALAEESLRRATDYEKHSENLSRKGYITRTQLEADSFAVEKAQLDLRLADQKLNVFRNHTRQRMEAEMTAEISKQQANLEAAEFTLELSEQREADISRQKDACRIVAPSDGQVVYANEIDRRGDTSFVIEEGAILRDGQPIFRLPDPSKMQVITKVNDSKINSVKVGQETLIRLDTDPENPVTGIVRRVASFPLPRRWYQAPIEYEVFVEVTDVTAAVRPGLRAKVEIFVERREDELMAPISAMVNRGSQHFVLVRDGDQVALREVKLGSNNDTFVIIESGLNPGDEVMIDPDRFIETVDIESETNDS